MALTLAQLADATGAKVHGDGGCEIHRVAALELAQSGDIAFLANARYRRYLRTTAATAVILGPDDLAQCPVHALVATNPYVTYARVASLLNPEPHEAPGVHPSAVVDPSAVIDPTATVAALSVIGADTIIGPHCVIGPGCVIGKACTIGEHTRLVARVTVGDRCTIGQRGLLHPGAVVGSDGFGQANDRGVWVKVPQLGRVVIADDVEVGANTTIDRGALGDTHIHEGVKLDNLIQVAHNVVIGAHTAIAGCAGIAGSAKIGRHCAIAGGAGIAGHLEIVDGVHITAMSLVTKSITAPGVYSSGTPLQENAKWHRNFVRFKKLDELAKRVAELERRHDEDHS